MGGTSAMVTRRITDKNGRPIGKDHFNPMLDTRVYKGQLEDGTHEHLMANKIAENLYAQVYDEGREILRFADIVDHRKDSTTLTEENSFIKVQVCGSKCIRTTKGWEMLVEWKDGTSSWLPLRDVKEASPIELAEYAVAMGLDKEPAFAWWVDYVLKKRDRIIKKAKSKYWRTTHKYDIRVPKTPEEALRIDKETGKDFWEKAMIKKMTKAKVSYELVDGCTPEESLLSTKYVQAVVANVENMLKEEGREFKTANSGKAKMYNPIPSGYKPELDTTEECDAEHHSRLQQLIGILRWAVELGRINIHIEVTIMSQYSANPRVGHLEAVYCIFHYLKCNPVKRLLMGPTTPAIDRNGFNGTADWAEFYGDYVVEEDPPVMSESLRKAVEIFATPTMRAMSSRGGPNQGYSYSHRTHSFTASARSRTQWRPALMVWSLSQ
ncbi:hypothetical protein ACHAWF_008256 [Thalassiosira exigua]